MNTIQRKRKNTASKSQKTAEKPKKVVKAAAKPPQKTTRKPVAKPPVKKVDRSKATAPRPKVETDRSGEFIPTQDQRELVTLAAGIGMTQRQICHLVVNSRTAKPISEPTLAKCFPDELESGAAKVMAKVAGTLVGIATDKKHKGCVTAGIFYLKTQAKWREPSDSAEVRRLEALVAANMGDREIEVRLVLEERPEHLSPIPDEDIPEAYR